MLGKCLFAVLKYGRTIYNGKLEKNDVEYLFKIRTKVLKCKIPSYVMALIFNPVYKSTLVNVNKEKDRKTWRDMWIDRTKPILS